MPFKCLRPSLAKISQVGKEGSNERPRLVLGIQPSSFQEIPTKGEPSYFRLHTRASTIESNRKDEQTQIPRSPVFGPQEGLIKAKSSPGPLTSKQTHQNSIVQNDLCGNCKKNNLQRCLHSVNRSQGCILAYSDSKALSPFPGLHHERPKIPISSPPFRAFSSSKGIHKNSSSHNSRSERHGNQRRCLSRRFIDLGKLKRTMQHRWHDHSKIPNEPRFSLKQKEIPSRTSKDIRVARYKLGYKEHGTVLARQTHNKTQEVGSSHFSFEEGNPKEFPIIPGASKLCFHNMSSFEMPNKKLVSIPQEIFNTSSSEISDPQEKIQLQEITPDLHNERSEEVFYEKGNKHGYSSTIHSDLHRCVLYRMGVSYLPRHRKKRSMVSPVQQTAHKCERNDRSLLCSDKPVPPPSQHNNFVLRQSSSSRDSKERRLLQSFPSEFLDVNHLKNPSKKSMDISTSPHKRIIELHSRCSLKRGTHTDRMDPKQRHIPLDPIKISGSSDRLVCNTTECPTSKVCFSNARPPSSSMQRFTGGLEPMGTDLPFPSSESPTQSTDEIKGIQRKSNTDSPRMAELELVSPTHVNEQEVISPRLFPSPNQLKSKILREVLSNKAPSRMDILKEALKNSWSEEVTEFLVSDVRASTIHQYESIWKAFTKYINLFPPSSITEDTIFKFLIYCFQDLKLATSTIRSYKSSLVPILKEAFHMDINDKRFEALFRSFSLKRPQIASNTIVSWDIDSLLNFINNMQRPLSITEIMSRCAVLLFLASSGRCSEVASFSRLPCHLQELDSGSFSILPLPKFIAKNEDPSCRFKPTIIHPFPSANPNLCPVRAIKEALSIVSPNSSSLILNPRNLKNISVPALRLLVCKFIREACPLTFPKTHDLRKISSSALLLSSKDIDSVIKKGRWKSSKTFIKHYLLDSITPNQQISHWIQKQHP